MGRPEPPLFSPWLLPLLALVARPLAGAGRPAAPFDARIELPLTVGIGVLGALFCAFWTAPPTFSGWPLTATDFGHYCQSVGAMVSGDDALWVAQRPRLPGLVAGITARSLGVVDGLAVGALTGTAMLMSGLYLWARAVHGRLAGLCAVLFGAALPPVAQLSRTLTFYPTITGAFVLCMASVAVAWRVRRIPAFVGVGCGAALALLTDVRGLVYALAALGIGALLTVRERRGAPVRWVAMVVPVALSWFLGRWAFPEGTPSLERQVSIWLMDARAHVEGATPASYFGPGFVWGRGSPLDFVRAIRWLAAAQAAMPANIETATDTVTQRAGIIGPWVGLAIPAAGVAVAGLWRRPWAIVVLVATLMPFMTSVSAVLRWLPRPHYAAGGMCGLAVVAGIAWATLVEGALAREDSLRRRDRTVLAAILGGALLFGAVASVFPSHLSAYAPWREGAKAGGSEPQGTLRRAEANTPDPADLQCVDALRADHARGFPYGSVVFGVP